MTLVSNECSGPTNHLPESQQQAELRLWKQSFYRPIQEARRRIRKLAGDAASSNPDSATARELQSTLAELQQTIISGLKFYEELTRNRGGLPLVSLARCHLFRGDMERYAQLHNARPVKNWDAAEAQYLKALDLVPDGGHAHNQLAVLATYRGDRFCALYHYCRAISAPQPFQQARSNIRQLLMGCNFGAADGSWDDDTLRLLHWHSNQQPQAKGADKLCHALAELLMSCTRGARLVAQRVVTIMCALAYGHEPLLPSVQPVLLQLLHSIAKVGCSVKENTAATECAKTLLFAMEGLDGISREDGIALTSAAKQMLVTHQEHHELKGVVAQICRQCNLHLQEDPTESTASLLSLMRREAVPVESPVPNPLSPAFNTCNYSWFDNQEQHKCCYSPQATEPSQGSSNKRKSHEMDMVLQEALCTFSVPRWAQQSRIPRTSDSHTCTPTLSHNPNKLHPTKLDILCNQKPKSHIQVEKVSWDCTEVSKVCVHSVNPFMFVT